MATPRKKYPYNFVYRDGRYVEFHLTREDFENVCKAKLSQQETVVVSIGFIELKDVVTAVEKVEPKVEEKKEKRVEEESFSKRFNVPHLDVESDKYLRKALADIWEEGDIQ